MFKYKRPPTPLPPWLVGFFFFLSFYFFFQETKPCSRNHSVIQFCVLRALSSGIITEWRLMIPFEEKFSLPQN